MAPRKNADVIPDDILQRAYDGEFENRRRFADKISEWCKFIWAGSIATFFALLTAAKDSQGATLFSATKYILLASAACGTIALVCDYFQNVSGDIHSEKITKWIEMQNRITYGEFNTKVKDAYTKMNGIFFILKNCFTIISAALIVIAILVFVLK
jgi:hypothetical protein